MEGYGPCVYYYIYNVHIYMWSEPDNNDDIQWWNPNNFTRLPHIVGVLHSWLIPIDLQITTKHGTVALACPSHIAKSLMMAFVDSSCIAWTCIPLRWSVGAGKAGNLPFSMIWFNLGGFLSMMDMDSPLILQQVHNVSNPGGPMNGRLNKICM